MNVCVNHSTVNDAFQDLGVRRQDRDRPVVRHIIFIATFIDKYYH